MSPERWQQIKPILEAARERPRGDLRDWLAAACGDDEELMRDVTAFLRYEDQLNGFIDKPALSFLTRATDDLDAIAGRRIGPYRLVRLLEKGGMGAVYLAEREEDFEQRVALKLIRPHFGGDETIRRFHAERQILARLEHPNIARLLDGGTAADGAPYFAMELIDGVPVDSYCDEERLSIRQRLELFLHVCSALELAHQNLVVHRDLKPGNILVDASGVPKLLDFGIAKLLSTEKMDNQATPIEHQAMTLRFASPEQLQEEVVGTTSDVYSLGVVLYLVLTGRLPCGIDRLRGFDLIQAICKHEPQPPSAVVLHTEEPRANGGGVRRLPPVIRTRDGSVRALRRRLRGDVDSIVLKALAKAPSERYASVEQLAADIRRHLDGWPVRARPATGPYLAGKFVHRHRLGLVATAVVVVIVLVSTVVLTRQLYEIERARDQKEELSAFLIDLFRASHPDRPGAEITVRDLLERGRSKLDVGLEDEPEARAELLRGLGEVYFGLGDFEGAREIFATAVGLQRPFGDHPELAAALSNLAAVHHRRGELEAAEELWRECIAMRRRLGHQDDLIKPMNGLATILYGRGDLDEAARIYRESLDLRRAALGGRHPNVAESQRSLAMVLLAIGDLDGAEPLLRESLDIRLEVYGPGSPRVASALVVLARLEHARGRLDEAEAFYTQTLEIRRRKLGDQHLNTALAKKELAALLLDRGENATARVLLDQALATLHRLRHWRIDEAEGLLGAYLAAEGRRDEAEVCLVAAHEALARRRGARALVTREMRRRLDDFLAGVE